MAYHIIYQNDRCVQKPAGRLPILTIACFALFYILVQYSWPEGAAYLHNITKNLRSHTTAVFNQFADSLWYGEKLQTAFSEFIENLI